MESLRVLGLLASDPSLSSLLARLGAIERLGQLSTGGREHRISQAAEKLAQRLSYLPSPPSSPSPPSGARPTRVGREEARGVHSFSSVAPRSHSPLPPRPPPPPPPPSLPPLPASPWTTLHPLTDGREPGGEGRGEGMTKADEQAFFEVGVRLQMAEVRVLMEACSQLGGELAHDFPPPTFLSRPSLLRSLLSLLRTTEEVEMSSLSSATMRAMLQLVDVTTRAVKHRLDPSEWTRPLASPSSRVGRGRGGVEMAEASYSEGSKVESGGWQVWQLADATWSAVVPTLRHREACPLALPLLLRVLPLLYSPPHTASEEERDASASLWRGYLDKWDIELLPILLLAVASVSVCPYQLLRLAAPPGITVLLRGLVGSPYFAVCEPIAHTSAQASLSLLDPSAERSAAAAASIERAAMLAHSLCTQEGETPTPGARIGWARARCDKLRRCLPALSYFHLPAIPATVFDLACSALPEEDKVTASELRSEIGEVVATLLAHPLAHVREATLKRISELLVSLHNSGEANAESRDEASSEEEWSAIEARAVAMDGVGVDPTAVTAMISLLMGRRQLQMLVELALMVSTTSRPLSQHFAAALALRTMLLHDWERARAGLKIGNEVDSPVSPSACTHATLAHGILNVIIQSVDRSELVQFVPLLPLIQVFDVRFPLNDTTDAQLTPQIELATMQLAKPSSRGSHEMRGEHARLLLNALLPEMDEATYLAAQ
ncbi:MAG: hypothetical protein SGPRY_012180, partial [Prymnesium sp.]